MREEASTWGRIILQHLAGSVIAQRRKKSKILTFSPFLPPDYPLLCLQSTKKDILSVPQILSHIPLFGVWSTKNRYSATVDEGSFHVHWIERSKLDMSKEDK
jgi:hypothetical protein